MLILIGSIPTEFENSTSFNLYCCVCSVLNSLHKNLSSAHFKFENDLIPRPRNGGTAEMKYAQIGVPVN